jgi:hypothetical protein
MEFDTSDQVPGRSSIVVQCLLGYIVHVYPFSLAAFSDYEFLASCTIPRTNCHYHIRNTHTLDHRAQNSTLTLPVQTRIA